MTFSEETQLEGEKKQWLKIISRHQQQTNNLQTLTQDNLHLGHIPEQVQGQSLGEVSPGSLWLEDTISQEIPTGELHHNNTPNLIWFIISEIRPCIHFQ